MNYDRLIGANATRVPLADALFGTLLSVSALEHFAEPDAMIGEVPPVLRPGGAARPQPSWRLCAEHRTHRPRGLYPR